MQQITSARTCRQCASIYQKKNSWLDYLTAPLIGVFILLIRCYQYTLSPLLGSNCRFYPSCSHYAIQCLQKHRIHFALYKTAKRLLRCHPWHPGGVDLP
ncbi:MAG: membrane protein insertion efficiency factor YidD [Oligoflexus sp.]